MRKLRVAIIGAGPAGVLVAANAALQGDRVLWFDESGFRSGQLAHYTTVPANTKIDFLHRFLSDGILEQLATRFETVRLAVDRIKTAAIPNPEVMRRHDPAEQGWPRLCDCQELFRVIAGCLRGLVNVACLAAKVHSLRQDELDVWTIRFGAQKTVIAADCVVLCAGTVEKVVPGLRECENGSSSTIRVLSCEQALDLQALQKSTSAADRIALCGSSHSSILALRNLNQLGYDLQQVTVFAYEDVKLAEWTGTQYKNTATGLKGMAAAFILEDRAASACTAGYRSPTLLLESIRGGEFDVLIPTIGFEPAAHPCIHKNGAAVGARDLKYDPATAALVHAPTHSSSSRGDGGGQHIGLYEVGSSRPEYFTDRIGLSNSAPAPVVALSGGAESQADGFFGERLVGFRLFALRAASVIAHAHARAGRRDFGVSRM
jgi:hypothetical protein